jgi:5-(carboxyamino)imidazole ribonucleotide synthase
MRLRRKWRTWPSFAPYDDLDQVAQFARSLDVLTFEFENVPAACAAAAEAETVVRPLGTRSRSRSTVALKRNSWRHAVCR